MAISGKGFRKLWNFFQQEKSGKDVVESSGRKLAEIKISIRCLATTLWFFCSQMCTFLPGIFLFGCRYVSYESCSFQTRTEILMYLDSFLGRYGNEGWQLRPSFVAVSAYLYFLVLPIPIYETLVLCDNGQRPLEWNSQNFCSREKADFNKEFKSCRSFSFVSHSLSSGNCTKNIRMRISI